MAHVTDSANEPRPGDALAAMAEPLRERIIEERIGREEGQACLDVLSRGLPDLRHNQ